MEKYYLFESNSIIFASQKYYSQLVNHDCNLSTSSIQGVTILTISTIIPTLKPPKCSPGGNPCIPATGKQLLVLYAALYLTALGTGGLKSSVSGFGSDQFDESNDKEKKQMIKFFDWFFFFISIGALLAVTVLVYIQDNLGREYGYGICACAILVGLGVFLSGTKRYRFKKLVGSPLTQIASVVVAAWRKRHLQPPSDTSLLFDIDEAVGDEGKKKSTPGSQIGSMPRRRIGQCQEGGQG